jgi:hypothetical protein
MMTRAAVLFLSIVIFSACASRLLQHPGFDVADATLWTRLTSRLLRRDDNETTLI